MYKFMQRNRKKMLAIFAVGLMIVFILPQVAFDQTRGTRQEVIAHTAGKEPVTMGEAREAQDRWRVVTKEMPYLLGPVGLLAEEIEKDPVLFVLLQRDARQLGLRVSDQQYEDMISRISQELAMFRQPVPDFRRLEPALRDVLLVRSLFERVAEGIKPSGATVNREMAANAQRVKLNLAHYASEDFKKDVAAPTPEQLQKQFDQFKSLPPNNPTESNPFGFGYLVPNKVQLLYVTVPREEVARAVRAGMKQIDWEIRAVDHYRQNLSKYPVTQPATTTAPTTTSAAASQPATVPLAAKPTTRPFAEVKEQVIREVMQPDVDRKLDQVAAAVGSPGTELEFAL